jgi:hypothetical protein
MTPFSWSILAVSGAVVLLAALALPVVALAMLDVPMRWIAGPARDGEGR